ncbi:MAG: hypothetical protein L0I24_04335 [Pseudonocardia sp.]|nr:hypothetical protein [Pseudonocardia sp.]
MPPPVSDTLRLVAEELHADATTLWARVLDDLATALPELAERGWSWRPTRRRCGCGSRP